MAYCEFSWEDDRNTSLCPGTSMTATGEHCSEMTLRAFSCLPTSWWSHQIHSRRHSFPFPDSIKRHRMSAETLQADKQSIDSKRKGVVSHC